MTVVARRLGAELRRRRRARGRSLSAAARGARVAGSALHYIEAGAVSIRLDTLFRICASYRVRVSDVVAAVERRRGSPEDLLDVWRRR